MSTAMLQTRISDMEHLFTRAWTDKDILLEALLAPGCGYTVAGARRVRFGHKPLAMLGDAVMKQLIIEQVYAQGATQEVIQGHVARIGANNNLKNKGTEFGLEAYILANPSQRGQISPRVMQDTVEALIGAAYLDGGVDAARHVMTVLGLV